MATTIQVSEKTRQMLEMVKRAAGTKTLDEALQRMLEEKTNVPASMFGRLKGKLKPFTRKERREMWRD